jgi:hypothetical protein
MMATRTVTGLVYNVDGSAIAGGHVVFMLLETFVTSTAVYPNAKSIEVLDTAGCLSTTLAVPDVGTAHYTVELPNGQVWEFYLASGPATDLMTIINTLGTPVDQDKAQTLMDIHVAAADPHPQYVLE